MFSILYYLLFFALPRQQQRPHQQLIISLDHPSGTDPWERRLFGSFRPLCNAAVDILALMLGEMNSLFRGNKKINIIDRVPPFGTQNVLCTACIILSRKTTLLGACSFAHNSA